MEATLQRGDAVLYKAKGAGGNRVIADAAERRRMPRLRKVDLTMAVSDNHAIPGHTFSPIGQLRMHLFYMTAINPNPDTEVDAEIASVLNSRPAILARAISSLLAAGSSVDEKAKLFSGTAKRVYRLA